MLPFFLFVIISKDLGFGIVLIDRLHIMGEYKEKNKTTRIGDLLRRMVDGGKTVAPSILDLAGTITGIEGLKSLGDKIRGSKELTDFDKELLLKELDFDVAEMHEATERLKTDNEHTITRLVRPVTFGAMFILFLAIVLLDGNIGSFKIKEVYIPVIQSLFSTMVIFYFSSRGLEKISKVMRKS